jgi:hypothetical protein
MTASEILNQWDPVSSVFRKAGTWIALVRLAKAGSQGCSLGDWPNSLGGVVPKRSTMNRWQTAGLVEYTETPRGRAHIIKRTWHITEKGLRLLRLDPEPVTP